MLPAKDRLTICFAHGAYRMAERFALRDTGIAHVEVRSAGGACRSTCRRRTCWSSPCCGRTSWPAAPSKLKFIQSISAGIDQYDKDAAARRTASASPAPPASTPRPSPSTRWR